MGIHRNKFLIIGKLFILLLFLTLPLIYLSLCSRGRSKEENRLIPSSYKYFQTNVNSGESLYGFVTSFEDLNEHGFLSFKDEFGNFRMYSKFGLDEYECRGTCYCSHDNLRRLSGHITSRPLYGLVAAVSSILALQFVKTRFYEECESIMEEYGCPHYIMSEVDECSEVGEKMEKDFKDAHQKEEQESPPYMCRGRCVATRFDLMAKFIFDEDRTKSGVRITEDRTIDSSGNTYSDESLFDDPTFVDLMIKPAQQIAEEFRCDILKLEKEILLLESGQTMLKKMEEGNIEEFGRGLKDYLEEGPDNFTPELMFMYTDLDTFCKEMSLIKNHKRAVGDMWLSAIKETHSLCSGHYLHFDKGESSILGGPNPSVECRVKN